MADFTNPKNTNPLLNLFGYVRDGFDSIARMFDGTTDSNVPTGAKRIDASDGQVYNWNGATWDSLGFVSDIADAGAQIAALGGGGFTYLFLSPSGSGDGSGGDASNRMSWSTFSSTYGSSGSGEPTGGGTLHLDMTTGTYTMTANNLFKNLDIRIVSGASNVTFSANIYFYACRISTVASATITFSSFGSTLTGCQLDIGTVAGTFVEFNSCTGAIDYTNMTSSFLSSHSTLNISAVASTTSGISITGGQVHIDTSATCGNLVVTRMGSLYVDGNLTVNSTNQTVQNGSQIYVVGTFTFATSFNVERFSRIMADAFSGTPTIDNTSFTQYGPT